MAINFPNNPNTNDIHYVSSLGQSWRWDGTTWKIYSSSTTGIAFGDLSVSQQAASGSGSLTYNNAGLFTYTPPAGGGGGSSTFTGLSDTPSSFTAGKWLKVNNSGNALEWTDAPTGNDTNDYLNTASLSGNTLTLGRTGSQSLANITVDLSSLNSVPTNITVANESTETVCYPLFTTAATGNLEPKTVTSFKLNSSSGQLEAGSFKKTGGSATEFLKADGSIDSNTYSQSTHTHTHSHSVALNDLTNVDATTNLANGKILKYDLGSTTWVVADDNASGGGSANFTGLSDTPSSLTAGKWLKVNAGATALEWTDAPSGSNTTYDLSATSSSGSAVVRLAGSDSTNDDVTFSAGGGISYAVTGNTVQISSANSLGGLTDTTITGSPTDNYVLTYDLASSKWEPQPIPGGSTPNLNAVLGAGNTSALAATVGDFTCSNLTVNGTTTTVNSNTVNIGDNILTLNSDETGTPSQNAGLEIERGTSTNVSLRWNEGTDKWEFTNDGTNYSDIASTSNTYSNSDVDTHLNQSSPTSGYVLSWNGSDYAWVAQTTDTNTFIGLTGTPSTYTANKWLKVNTGGTALEYTDAPAAAVITDDTAPGSPSDGDLWWDSDSGRLNVYYQDTDSAQWVDASPLGAPNIQGDMTGHIIPTSNASYDLGNASYKIRHLFLSDSSLKFGDAQKSLGVSGTGQLQFDGKDLLQSVVLSGVDNNHTIKYDGTNWVNTAPASAPTFLTLSDTPSSFTAGKWLKVNAGGTALEEADAPSQGAPAFQSNWRIPL